MGQLTRKPVPVATAREELRQTPPPAEVRGRLDRDAVLEFVRALARDQARRDFEEAHK